MLIVVFWRVVDIDNFCLHHHVSFWWFHYGIFLKLLLYPLLQILLHGFKERFKITSISPTGDRACQNNRALISFPSRQEIDKSLKSKKLQISSIFATLRLLYRVIDIPIFIFRFSCLISECHQLVNKDIFTLVMMMTKKSRWFQSRNVLRIAVTKSNWRQSK